MRLVTFVRKKCPLPLHGVFLLLFLGMGIRILGQPNTIDSLETLLENSEVSHEQLFAIGRAFENTRSDYSNAIACYKLASEKARHENDLKYLDYDIWLGYTLSRTGETDQGLFYNLTVVETIENKQLWNKLPYATLLLAFAYRNAAQYDKAEHYFNKCIESSLRVSDSSHIHTALHELGNLYMVRKDYSQALSYHKEALELRIKMKKKSAFIYSYHDIAQDYTYMDSMHLALEYYGKARQLAIEYNDQLTLFYIYNGIASVYQSTGNLTQLRPYLDTMQILAQKLNLKPVFRWLFDTYYNYYKFTHQYEKALTAYEQMMVYKDSISDETTRKNISELDRKYEMAKKDKELVEKQASIKRQQILMLFIGLVILLLIGFMIVIFRNYKEKKSAYNKLEWLNQNILRQREEIVLAKIEAERSNLAKSEFLSRMSHELRTPLNAILGFAQLLESADLKERQRKGINHILTNGRHLLSLINDILDISGIEAGKQTLTFESILLREILEEVTDCVQVVAEKNHVGIHLKESSADRLFVYADRRRLKQVLINLLNNAVKYNREGGTVTLDAVQLPEDVRGKNRVRISVRDTGYGIPQADLGRLFQPFERIGAEKTETEGTGLGLVMVKKLTEEMDGNVGVFSEIDIGSTFWIDVLVTGINPSGIAPASDSDIPDQAECHQQQTVLYVEDQLSNIDLVDDILAEHRPEIKLISTRLGKQASELAKQHQPGHIFLDLDLPDLNGIDVLKQLLSDPLTSSIPVIIISADAMPFQIENLIKTGAAGYLIKPLDVEKFLKILDKNTGTS